MRASEAIFALMNRTDKNWSCYTPAANQAVHRVAMNASREMMRLMDKAEQAGSFPVSIADRFKIIEKAATRFQKLAKDRVDEGVADGEPRRALRDYCGNLLAVTGMEDTLYDEFLFQTF